MNLHLTSAFLRQKLHQLSGKGYGSYQTLLGSYQFDNFTLRIDKIPKDPYAPPGTGVFSLQVDTAASGFPAEFYDSKIREIAFRDYLARQFCLVAKKVSGEKKRGTGYSGIFSIAEPGQCILERSSVVLIQDKLEVRFFIGLPAKGRSVDIELAEVMLLEELPEIVLKSLYSTSLSLEQGRKHIELTEDSESLRNQLKDNGLVAFIRNGAILPRQSGISQLPLSSSSAKPFLSPLSLQVDFMVPHAGKISGLGIPEGVTLIVGGGYHGKSTLLQAAEMGVYNHIQGDGRELCVTREDAVKILASTGRYVEKTDISLFIDNLPDQSNTEFFSTDNASGSTSQAASFIEAMETGSRLLLLDEDTSASNFMTRDLRMQTLVSKNREPVTPLIDRIDSLKLEESLSMILVMGSSGDYFEAADAVIQMDAYIPSDVFSESGRIALEFPSTRKKEGGLYQRKTVSRIPVAESLDPVSNMGKVKVRALEKDKLLYGSELVQLDDVEQIVELAQVQWIGQVLKYLNEKQDAGQGLPELLGELMSELGEKGIEMLDSRRNGHLSMGRKYEAAAVLNRLRKMKMRSMLPKQ